MNQPRSLSDQLSSLLVSGGLSVRPAVTTPPSRKVKGPQVLRRKVAVAVATTTVPDDTPDLPTTPPMQLVPVTEPGENIMATDDQETDQEAESVANKVSDEVLAQLIERQRKRLKTLVRKETREDRQNRLRSVEASSRRLYQAVKAKFKRTSPQTASLVDDALWLANAALSAREAHRALDLPTVELVALRNQALAKLESLAEGLVPDTEVTGTRLADLEASHFRQYIKFKARLPTETSMVRAGLRFKALTLPLVVMFSRPVKRQQLEEEGFEADDAGGDPQYFRGDNSGLTNVSSGFIILRDQTVWAVCGKMLKESETWEGDEEEYLRRLLNLYRKRTGSTGVVMGPENKQKIGHAATKGITYYWVMPQREQRALPASIKDWGFPF